MPDKTRPAKKTIEYKGQRAMVFGYVQPDAKTGEYPEEIVFACCGYGCKLWVIGTPEAIRIGGGRHWVGGTRGNPVPRTTVLCTRCAGRRR